MFCQLLCHIAKFGGTLLIFVAAQRLSLLDVRIASMAMDILCLNFGQTSLVGEISCREAENCDTAAKCATR